MCTTDVIIGDPVFINGILISFCYSYIVSMDPRHYSKKLFRSFCRPDSRLPCAFIFVGNVNSSFVWMEFFHSDKLQLLAPSPKSSFKFFEFRNMIRKMLNLHNSLFYNFFFILDIHVEIYEQMEKL